jgi:cation diffusion facilitator family transporter
MEGGSRRAIVAAFGANLGIAVAKFVGFALTGAASMLAEAVHSVADTSNQALLLLGSKRSQRAPDPEHPFGHGRERYFWAFVVALVIFSVGSVFALVDGVSKLRTPHKLESVPAGVVVLIVAMGFEAFSFRTARRESRADMEAAGSWWRYIRGAKEPELPVVLLEDAGALVGLTFALAGLLLAHVTGNPRFDAAGSVAIGLLLGVIAFVLVVEMKSLLIGEAASPQQVAAIRNAIESDEHVSRLIHLRTEHLGPDELLVGAKLEFSGHMHFPDVAKAIDGVEVRIRAAVPSARLIYLEPDVARQDP